MKTSKSHSRGDHVMERFHTAKHSFFGSWRCQPCAGDFVSPGSRAQKHRGEKKDRKDPNFDPDFVKSNKKVSEEEDRRDPNFDPEFVKSSQTAPAREDSKGPANITKSSQPTAAKPYRKGRSLRSFMNDSQPQPKAREDHLLLENQSWRKEEDAEGNRKGESGKINEQLQPTHLEDGNELKPQDKNAKHLEGKDAKVPSPTDLPETESLKLSQPVNNTPVSDEAAAKETSRKDAEGNRKGESGKINEQLQPTHLEDGNELKPQDKIAKNLEGKDAKVPSPTDLPETESLKQSEPVNNTPISDAEGNGKGESGKINEQVQPTHEDGNELKPQDKNAKSLEGKDAKVPSPTILPETESLKHSEPVNDTTISDEAAAKETPRIDAEGNRKGESGKANEQLKPTHLEDGNELKPQDKNAKSLEGRDAKVPSPTNLPETESLKHSEPVNDTTISDEAAAKETPRKDAEGNRKGESGKTNEQLKPTHLEDGNELKPQDKNAKNLEGKDAKVPSPTVLPEMESLKYSEPVNDTTISDEATAKETPRKGSQSYHGQVNGGVKAKSQEDRHELEFPDEDKECLGEKDAVPSHTGLENSESLNQVDQVSSSSVSGEVVGKGNEQREDSPSQRADMNGQLPPTSQPDEQELKAPEVNLGNLEGTYRVPSHQSVSNILPITEFLEQLEPDSKITASDEDKVPPDGSQGQFSQSSKKGTRSVMQCAPEKDSRHEKRLQAESLEELDAVHKTIAAHAGAQGEVEHRSDSPPPEYLKQFSQTSEGQDGGKSIDMLIQYWEEKRKHHPEDVVHEGKFQHTGSQILECPKEFSKANSNRLSRRRSRSAAEHLESPYSQGNLSKQKSDIDAAGQNTNIPHSESYAGPKETEGEKVTPANSTGRPQTQNEIFGAPGFKDAEQGWDFPKLDGDGLHSAGSEKPGAPEDANPTHPLNGMTDQDSQNRRQASRSLKDTHKSNSARPSRASSEDEFQHHEGKSPGETKSAMNSDRHQEMDGKKKEDGLHGKQAQHADQEDHYSRNTGLLPLNFADLNRAKGTKPPNAGSEHQSEHQDDFYRDHGKGEKMQDSFIEKQIHGAASDPEECFPNSDNLEEFLSRNGYKKGASNSAHGNGSRISSSHEQRKAENTCLWDRVSAHDIGEDKTGHLYRDHSQHIGHSHHTEHSHRPGLPDHTDRGEEAARAEETSAWKLGFFSVPHIVAVGALTALSVLGKAAN